jgi:Ca-activated chloride channel homolog
VRLGLAHPELLPLGLAAAALIALTVFTLIRRRRAQLLFGGASARLVSASPTLQIAKLGLVACACLCLAIAFVGPQIGEAPRRGATAAIDTVIALDVSQSMAVKDVVPDRLRAAQQAIEAIGQELAGGRVALTLFAGTSVVRYPLTADTKIVGPALDTSGRGFRITPGSSLRAAVQGAAGVFPTDAGSERRAKAIVVVSDGEDLAAEMPQLEALRARNIRVFAVGIGTAAGGPIPLYDQRGQFQQMLVDPSGAQVTSRLDEVKLQALADQGGGRYLRYEGETSARELANALRAIEAEPATTEAGVSPDDRYQIFLGIAVVALLVEWLLDERRTMPRPRVARSRPARGRRLLGVLGAGLLAVVACGPADPVISQVDSANELYKRDPAGALARYRDLQQARPSSPEITINLANTLAQLGENERALIQYGRALDNAKGTTRAIAFYDRGNALFGLGRVVEARASYVEALRIDPNDRDAKFNIEIIDRILAEVPPSAPSAQPSQPGQQSPAPAQSPAGQSGAPGPTGAAGSGAPAASPPPGSTGQPSPSTPESVETALDDFRRDLTVDEALRLLDALRNEQRGLPALLEGQGIRRGTTFDTPY